MMTINAPLNVRIALWGIALGDNAMWHRGIEEQDSFDAMQYNDMILLIHALAVFAAKVSKAG